VIGNGFLSQQSSNGSEPVSLTAGPGTSALPKDGYPSCPEQVAGFAKGRRNRERAASAEVV